jgi:hypothetical protein
LPGEVAPDGGQEEPGRGRGGVAVPDLGRGDERDEGPVALASGGHAVYSSARTCSCADVHDGVTRVIRDVVP